MNDISRRAALGLLAASPLALPHIARAQTAPIKIGLLSDVSGPYRENGGLGSKAAAELAVEEFGGMVLGRPLQVLQADDQNKADVASELARQWIDTEKVDVLVDGASSAAGLAIEQVSREKKRIYLITSPLSTTMVGKQCSPYAFQFIGHTYALTKGVADTLTRQGGDTWFIIAVDYEVGYALQASFEEFVTSAGGKVLGAVRAPLGTADYSSYLLQAQSSGAKVIGLGLGGADLQNCIKQAAEFGVTKSGQVLATPVLGDVDVLSIGQDSCKGLMLSSSFYWNLSPQTRAWSERYIAKTTKLPMQYQASAYAGVLHWLKAVKAAGTLEADTVAPKMRELPVDDMYNKAIKIQPNGSVPLTIYLFQVKPSAQSKERWDLYDLRGTLPSPQAYPPPGLFGCPLV